MPERSVNDAWQTMSNDNALMTRRDSTNRCRQKKAIKKEKSGDQINQKKDKLVHCTERINIKKDKSQHHVNHDVIVPPTNPQIDAIGLQPRAQTRAQPLFLGINARKTEQFGIVFIL